MAQQNDTAKLAVFISIIHQNGTSGSYRIDVRDGEQGQRILDQLNAPDDFVLIGERGQTGTLRLQKSLIVSASIKMIDSRGSVL